MPLDARTKEKLMEIVGENNVIDDPTLFGPYTDDFTDHYKSEPLAVVRPKSTEEVSRVVRYCYDNDIPMIPQGGNTSLTAGACTSEPNRQVIISLCRMKKLIKADPLSETMTVECGMTLEEAQLHAEDCDRLFPLSFASKGNATIGGCLACNAGGVNVLHYGTARELTLGIEAVLPDGRVWDGLRSLRKDNTGYDLRDLFIGSEGTLVIITKAVLKLFPLPKTREMAFCCLQSPEDAVKLLNKAKAVAGSQLTAFELISDNAIQRVRKHLPDIEVPTFSPSPWKVLMEVSLFQPREESVLEPILEDALESNLISDALIANSLKEENTFWHVRESIPLADRTAGGSLHSDVSLPISVIPEFIRTTVEKLEGRFSWFGESVYGHLGDGNMHFNLVSLEEPEKSYENEKEFRDILYSAVNSYNGSISAEHGIGQLKREHNYQFKDPLEIEMMKKIKDIFDPKGLMNPDKLLKA